MENNKSLQPNLEDAKKFLQALAGDERTRFVFQTFDDNQSEGSDKRHELTKVFVGTLEEHAETLIKLNQKGAGVFAQVNVADGNGRKAKNITALRAVFIDKDDGDIGELKIKPSILVQTKHGQHAFWKLVPGEPVEKFTSTQKALIQNLNTDRSVHNLDRLMRLPGFLHQKDPADPFLVAVCETNDIAYSINEVLETYPLAEAKRKTKAKSSANDQAVDGNKKLSKFKKWVSKQSTGEGGRNATVVKIVREGLGQGIGEESLQSIIEDYCDESGLPGEEGQKILDRHILAHEENEFDPYQNLSDRYEVVDGKITWNKPTRDGTTPVALCNFNAKIVKEEIHDDGAESKTYFQIVGTSADGKPLPSISITAEEFSSLNWITSKWGQRAYAYARAGEHLRVAILELSGMTESVSIFKHTGWRKVGDQYHYLNANGAIGTTGTVSTVAVDLKNGKLGDYALPTPPKGEELKVAVKASLAILDIAPKHVTYPLLATVYRSILAECKSADYSIFVSGPTGCFKSSLIGSIQAHFGEKFNTSHLPDNWTSTENALEKKSFLLKDCVFTIDEWTANGTHAEADKLRAKAERILRSQGNQAGRGRMSSSCDMRPEYFPRGIIISTGEDMPPGQSLRARTVQIEMSHGDVNRSRLSAAQKCATDGLMAQSTAAFVQWLAPQMENLKRRIPRLQTTLRNSIQSSQMHNRTPDIAASLGVGLRMFLKFAHQSHVITKAEMNSVWQDGWEALLKIAEKQSGYQNTEDHTHKFINYVRYALNIGEAYIVNAKTGEVSVEFGVRSGGQSKKIGWLDGSDVCLDPDASFSLVQQLARQQNEAIPISKHTLAKRLAQKGLILPSDTENRNTIKRTVEGRRQYVLVFQHKNLFLEKDEKQSSKPVSDVPGSEKSGGAQ